MADAVPHTFVDDDAIANVLTYIKLRKYQAHANVTESDIATNRRFAVDVRIG